MPYSCLSPVIEKTECGILSRRHANFRLCSNGEYAFRLVRMPILKIRIFRESIIAFFQICVLPRRNAYLRFGGLQIDLLSPLDFYYKFAFSLSGWLLALFGWSLASCELDPSGIFQNMCVLSRRNAHFSFGGFLSKRYIS